MRELIITDEMLVLSSRRGFVSFFYRQGDSRLYVFNQSVEKLQSYYKTPLRPLMLMSGVIYVMVTEEKVVAAGVRCKNPLVRREWGYEQAYLKKGTADS